jgi:hypothetical protein
VQCSAAAQQCTAQASVLLWFRTMRLDRLHSKRLMHNVLINAYWQQRQRRLRWRPRLQTGQQLLVGRERTGRA